MQTSVLPRLLTTKDMAQTLNVCERTAERLVASKTIPAIRIGRAVRIRPEDLSAYIERVREAV